MRTMPDTIEFAGLTLAPHRFATREEDGGIIIDLQATLTEQDTEAIRGLQREPRDYFDVLRAGESKPLEMRLGRVLWQPADNGLSDHQITLVSKAVDANTEKPWVAWHEPEVGVLMEAVLSLRAGMHLLMEAMKSGEPLDAALVERIREAGPKAASEEIWRFHETGDVTIYWTGDDDETEE
jgi:hypothetical protein